MYATNKKIYLMILLTSSAMMVRATDQMFYAKTNGGIKTTFQIASMKN